MKLIKKLGRRKSDTAQFPQSWGLFLCPFCNKEVERALSNGNKNGSCGCERGRGQRTHGLSWVDGKHHPLFVVWNIMRQRCSNPKASFYKRYGGRGISVCPEWANDYRAFYQWATKAGWQQGLQLDRINNDGDYSPFNCRFVTPAINAQNSTVAKLNADIVAEIRRTFPGSGLTYREFGKHYGVTGESISNIIRNLTWKAA